MILPNGAVVAVVDGQRMRLLRNVGHDPHVELAALADPDLGVENTGSGARHRSSSANHDARRLDEDDFAAAAAEYLGRQALSGAIGQVVIIADPRTLGELRRHFSVGFTRHVIGEIAKDLTAHSADAIEAAIAAA